MAAAGAATIPALQMTLASEDHELTIQVKILAFDQFILLRIFHFDSFALELNPALTGMAARLPESSACPPRSPPDDADCDLDYMLRRWNACSS